MFLWGATLICPLGTALGDIASTLGLTDPTTRHGDHIEEELAAPAAP